MQIILIFLMSFFSHAKLFQNSYVKFELPSNWQCKMQQTEWICRSQNQQSAKEAIIILTAKEVGPSDTLTEYEMYLKKPKVSVNKSGKSQPAKIKQINRRKVKGHEWVDGLILGSEIPNFYTRYLATTKSKIAVLVTFTAHQRYYTKYSRDFFNAIKSLEVIANDSLLKSRNINPSGGSSLLGYDVGGVIPSDMLAENDCVEGEDCYALEGANQDDLGDYALILVVLILGVGAYLVLRK